MSGSSSTTYDDLPFESQTVVPFHPDRLATVARLFGLEAPAVEQCRVLELGSGQGEHLAGMAHPLPHATFVGVELAARQVAEGRATAAELGLDNVDLRTMSLADIDASFGIFDYIVCHGVYSWVPHQVQQKILEICRSNLAPSGVAFVSYNVYPGWHQRSSVREMMLYHTRAIADPRARVQAARDFLELLTRSATPQRTPYALALEQLLDLLRKCSDSYLYHEYLEAENHPVLFQEFVERADGAGLRYLGPAEFTLLEVGLSPDVCETLARFGPDRIRREQYVDFVLNRAFRRSLWCHAERATCEAPDPDAVRSLRVSALVRPESETPDVRTDANEKFFTSSDIKLVVNQPVLKAIASVLDQRRPQSAAFEELRLETAALLSRDPMGELEPQNFAKFVLRGYLTGFVDLHAYDPPIASEPGPRPCASAFARRRAERGLGVVNLRNQRADLEDLDLLVLPFLDGTRDQSTLVRDLARQVAEGRLPIRNAGEPIRDATEAEALLADPVAASLRRIAREALMYAQ